MGLQPRQEVHLHFRHTFTYGLKVILHNHFNNSVYEAKLWV